MRGKGRLFALLAGVAFASGASTGEPSLAAAVGWALLGVIASSYGVIIGAGGGFLMVPALVILGGLGGPQAAGTSLTIVAISSVIAASMSSRREGVDLKTVGLLALGTLPGSVLGAWASPRLDGPWFPRIFAGLLASVALVLLLRPTSEDPQRAAGRRRLWAGVSAALLIGFASSILGIGGGILMVPTLILALGYPPALATATSQLVLSITATVGAGSHLWLGHVLLPLALCLASGAILGARLGAELAPKIRGPWVVRLLALGLVLVAARLVWR